MSTRTTGSRVRKFIILLDSRYACDAGLIGAIGILCALVSARSLSYHAASVVGNGPLDEETEIACRMARAQAGEALLFAGDGFRRTAP